MFVLRGGPLRVEDMQEKLTILDELMVDVFERCGDVLSILHCMLAWPCCFVSPLLRRQLLNWHCLGFGEEV